MKVASIAGIFLIVLGVIGFIAKGITYTKHEEIVDLGPLEVEAETEETIPITPIASGLAVVAGTAVLAFARKEDD